MEPFGGLVPLTSLWGADARSAGDEQGQLVWSIEGDARPCRAGFPCVFAATAVMFALAAPAAVASGESFTWTGLASKGPEWSLAENWEANAAPAPGAEIETLTFPRLTTPPCSNEEFELPTSPCYSWNNLGGLSVESITIDDGDYHFIGGEEELSLSRGLTAAPAAGSKGTAAAIIDLPLRLTKSQTWSVSGRGNELGENQLPSVPA